MAGRRAQAQPPLSFNRRNTVSEAIILVGNKQIEMKEPLWIRLPGVRSVRRLLSRRDFEGQVAKLVNSALGHESEGLAAGADEYIRLANMAEAAVTKYCDDWNVDRKNLEAQIPALRKLNNLAAPPPPKIPKVTASVVVVGILGLAASLFAIGAASGLCSAGFHIVVNHLVR
jgi:hypothetical protein